MPFCVSLIGPRPVVLAIRRSAPSCPAFSRRITRTASRADFGISATIRSGLSGIAHPQDCEAQHTGESLELIEFATMAALVRGGYRLCGARLRADLLQHGEVPAGEACQEWRMVTGRHAADRADLKVRHAVTDRSRRAMAAARSPNCDRPAFRWCPVR
jgi:hypothetical protein